MQRHKTLGCLQEVVDWVAGLPLVQWVEPQAQVHRHNYLATGICQSDTAASLDSNGYGLSAASSHQIWAAGLRVRCLLGFRVQGLVSLNAKWNQNRAVGLMAQSQASAQVWMGEQ